MTIVAQIGDFWKSSRGRLRKGLWGPELTARHFHHRILPYRSAAGAFFLNTMPSVRFCNVWGRVCDGKRPQNFLARLRRARDLIGRHSDPLKCNSDPLNRRPPPPPPLPPPRLPTPDSPNPHGRPSPAPEQNPSRSRILAPTVTM